MRAEKPAVLITGAAKRVGQNMALYLASQGYDIALHYHNSQKEAEAVLPLVASFGQDCQLFQADLFDSESAVTLVEQVFAAFPKLELLINNASIFYPLCFKETTPDIFEQFFNLHLKTPFFLMQTFAKHCKQGQIINLLDADIGENKTAYFPYILSKKALADLTLLAAKELGPAIRVNGIAPGYVLTPVAGNLDPGVVHAQKMPLQRLGNLTDIQQGLQSLLNLTYVTGQILYIDGGQHLLSTTEKN